MRKVELRYEEKNAPFDVYKTYCEARIIDQNFLDRYERPERITDPIQDPPRTLVISQWYRDNLGGLHTQQGYLIRVRKLRFPGWRALRAASHHPDIAVRVGTKLGMLGVWLGFVALAEALINKLTGNHPEGVPSSEVPFVVLLVIVSAFSAVLCWMPCRAPKRPEPSSATSESSPQCTSDRRESTERLSS